MLSSASHVMPRRVPNRALRGFRVAVGLAGTVVLAAAVLVLVGVGLGPRLGYYRSLTVLSGSMEPAFGPGDVVIVTREPIDDIRPGQVITYAIPLGDHHVETHRVLRVLRRGDRTVVITKGDANAAADPWKAELQGSQVWRYRFRLPMLGRAIVALRDPLVHKLTVLLLPALLALYGLARIWRRRPEEKLDARTNP